MKFVTIALALVLASTAAFADHKKGHKKTTTTTTTTTAEGHDKEHAHVATDKQDHMHDKAHHEAHDHKAHHPTHDEDQAAAKK